MESTPLLKNDTREKLENELTAGLVVSASILVIGGFVCAVCWPIFSDIPPPTLGSQLDGCMDVPCLVDRNIVENPSDNVTTVVSEYGSDRYISGRIIGGMLSFLTTTTILSGITTCYILRIRHHLNASGFTGVSS